MDSEDKRQGLEQVRARIEELRNEILVAGLPVIRCAVTADRYRDEIVICRIFILADTVMHEHGLKRRVTHAGGEHQVVFKGRSGNRESACVPLCVSFWRAGQCQVGRLPGLKSRTLLVRSG